MTTREAPLSFFGFLAATGSIDAYSGATIESSGQLPPK
jgi:hypothetical protein